MRRSEQRGDVPAGLEQLDRRRQRLRRLIDRATLQARRLRGVPVDADDRGGALRSIRADSTMRAFMVVVGVALIVIGLVSFAATASRWATVNAPPAFGVVQQPIAVAGCEAAALTVSNPPAEVIAEAPPGILSPERAEDYADSVLHAHLDAGAGAVPPFAGGPLLVSATLPDGSRQTVWARVWVIRVLDLPQIALDATPDPAAAPGTGGAAAGDAPPEPNALVVYVEPTSGRPLALYEGVTVQQPLLSGCDETFVSEAAETVWKALVPSRQQVALAIVFVVGAATLAFWQLGGRPLPARR